MEEPIKDVDKKKSFSIKKYFSTNAILMFLFIVLSMVLLSLLAYKAGYVNGQIAGTPREIIDCCLNQKPEWYVMNFT